MFLLPRGKAKNAFDLVGDNRDPRGPTASEGPFEEHRTCNHHPIHRAINAGYIAWDEVFRVERTATGAVVHAKPGANDHVGEIIAAGWGAGHPASHTAQIVTGWMNSPGHRKEIFTGRHEEMGIGVACTPDGRDTFWWVVFGRALE